METPLQPLQEAKTRGTKRAAASSAAASKENAAPMIQPTAAAKKLSSTTDVAAKGANKFGFRASALAASLQANATAAIVSTLLTPSQQAKRRKTDPEDSNASSNIEQQLADQMEDVPSVLAALSAPPLEPLIPAPSDRVVNLWNISMMDDGLKEECKQALAGKITANKFDYKEKIGQLEAQMKTLRKVVSTLVKKQDTFLVEATAIEAELNDNIVKEKMTARDLNQIKIQLQEKLNKALLLLKQTQSQRDVLINESKVTSTQLAAHATVLAEKDAEKMEIENKLTCVNKDLMDTMNALDVTTTEREAAKALVVELQTKFDELEALYVQLETDKNNLMQTCETQDAMIEEEKNKVAEMEKDLAAAREQYVTLMNQWTALQKAHEKSEEMVRSLTASLDETKAALESETAAHDGTKAALAKAESAVVEAKVAHATEIASTRAANQREYESLKLQMDLALAKNKEEIDSLTVSLDNLSQVKNSLMESANKTSLEMVQLRTNLLHASDKSSSMDLEVKKLEGELQLVKLQLEKKNEECFVTIKNFEKIQQFHEERQTILQTEKENLEKNKMELTNKFMSLETTLKNTQGQLEATTSALSEKSTAFDTIKAEFASFQTNSQEEKQNFEKQIAEFKVQLATVQTELAEKTKTFEGKVTELNTKLTSETERATNLSRELSSFKALSGVSSESQMENLVKLSMEAETLRMQVKDKGDMARTLMETQSKLEEALKKIAESESTRRALHNRIQEILGNIRVFTRVRPLLQAGAPRADATGDVNMLTGDDAINAVDVSADGKKLRLDGGNGTKSNFSFDAVWGPATTQKDIFEEISPLVQSALDGYHVCLFSYGQTGSGKTWTMTGSVTGEQRGIIPRSVEKILEQSQNLSIGGWTYQLEASYLEIYCEVIRDLLCSNSSESDLDVKRDTNGRTSIPGLTRCAINNINDVGVLMHKAAKSRATASTNMNERSSRSHSVFTLYLSATNPINKQTLSGSLNLCDLAGSERLNKSGAGTDAARLRETQAINKSLSSLSDVFLSLSQKNAHIPFRNSKLTYLLQPCLSGDGKTAMIVNLNPSLSSAGESMCTLRFAAQVNAVELGRPKKSTKSGDEAIEAMTVSASTSSASASGALTARTSLSGSASVSGIARPASASTSSIAKKPAIPRPTTALKR